MAAYGEVITLTATVTVIRRGGMPTGTVDFYDGDTLIGTGRWMSRARPRSLLCRRLDYGMHTITAVYEGDDDFSTSTSTGISVAVGQDTTTATVSPLDPAVYGRR